MSPQYSVLRLVNMRSNAIFSESKNGRTLLSRKSAAVRAFLSGYTLEKPTLEWVSIAVC